MAVFEGKVVLVTGGTGSFGRCVVPRLLAAGAQEIRIFSRDEKKQFDMRHSLTDERLSFHLGDVRDPRSVREVMAGVGIIVHAAALKQVPRCERFPRQALETNVAGAANVVEAAMDAEVERVVAISTDKAVQPVNVMGMTKALQERIVVNAMVATQNRNTRFTVVRYGNILNSRGSVIPFFRALLRRGEPLKITDEKMTRFLLTLNDAVDIIFHACEHAQGGEIFVKKAPSARVLDVARAVCAIEETDFEYELIGVYPGEKIHEILISEEERSRCEDRGAYYLIHPWQQRPQKPTDVGEYSSCDELIPLPEVEKLIRKADEDAVALDLDEGYFFR